MSDIRLDSRGEPQSPPPPPFIETLLDIGLWAFMRHHPTAAFEVYREAKERLERLLERRP